jgi:SAM-dependent methyltransferase
MTDPAVAIDKKTQFLTAFTDALQAGDFVRLSLANYVGADETLRNIIARKVVIKQEEKISLTFRHKTRDIVKNHPVNDGVEMIAAELGSNFMAATLFTTGFDLTLQNAGGKKQTLKKSAATTTDAVAPTHDRQKTRLVETEGRAYLQALKITDGNGQVLKSAQDKYRQIDKFVEIIGTLIRTNESLSIKRIIDMGSGKGYLTFALYDYLTRTLGRQVEVTGVELRPDMVALCNRIAQNEKFTGLKFIEGAIRETDCSEVDLLIALHACDTATDDALYQGIRNNAQAIIVAPCCHKQVRRELEKSGGAPEIAFMLRHGTFLERHSEMATDALRALLLEKCGYSTKVFEFISDAHTPKNVMIVAVKDGKAKPEKAAREYAQAKETLGIGEHALEKLLAGAGFITPQP